MATKNVKLKHGADELLPKTKGSLVYNDAGNTLGGVEAGAQVNKLEKITIDGVEVTITNKTAAITLPTISEYSLVKQAVAETGFATTFYLTKDGTQVGDKINIAKDMVVESGSVKTCTVADQPVEGYQVGDKYIDLVIANKTSSHIYILVSDLVDVYTQGTGITISGNQISVNTSVIATVQALNDGLAGKEPTLTGAKLDAVNSGITSTLVAKYNGYEATINGKADSATTLAGYGITDAYTKTQIDTAVSGFITYEEIE